MKITFLATLSILFLPHQQARANWRLQWMECALPGPPSLSAHRTEARAATQAPHLSL